MTQAVTIFIFTGRQYPNEASRTRVCGTLKIYLFYESRSGIENYKVHLETKYDELIMSRNEVVY